MRTILSSGIAWRGPSGVAMSKRSEAGWPLDAGIASRGMTEGFREEYGCYFPVIRHMRAASRTAAF